MIDQVLVFFAFGIVLHESYEVKVLQKKRLVLLVILTIIVMFHYLSTYKPTIGAPHQGDNIVNAQTPFHDVTPHYVTRRQPLEYERCDAFTEILKDPRGKLFSQFGQDNVLYMIFKDYRGGVFLDLAACYPKLLSNTYYLETCLAWTGFCVEADPRKIVDLVKNRTCQVVPECVTENRQIVNFGSDAIKGTNSIHEHKKKGSVELTCEPLHTLLTKYGAPRRIDFMSLDIEGSEDGALLSIGPYTVDIMTIELAHLRKNTAKSAVIQHFLLENDYRPVVGFPSNKAILCDPSEPGNNIWGLTIEELFAPIYNQGKHKHQTHDVLFVRRDSRHYDRVPTIFKC
jgi:hypothetical protein